MERVGNQYEAENLPHAIVFSPEQLALQALVDKLFAESDARVFAIQNQYFQEEDML